MTSETIPKPRVAIERADTASECLSKSIESLGGIREFVQEGDIVFLKISLRLPFGFPTNSNLDLIKKVIELCGQANPKKIYVSSFPAGSITLAKFDDLMDLEEYFRNLGAEFIYLDNSDIYRTNSVKSEELKKIKENTLQKVKFDNETVEIPKIILDSDKVININQVNVAPNNICTISLINQYSILPYHHRNLDCAGREKTKIIEKKLYLKDQINRILETYLIKKPTLTINDLFYVLEGAGPFIYKDSNLKKTYLLVVGTDSIAVDVITLMLMNIETSKSSLLVEAVNREIGPKLLSDIELVGLDLDENKFEIKMCEKDLSKIKIQNLHTHCGKMCSGCFSKAYHLLHIIKSYLIKDLKYIGNNNIVVGLKPPELSTENDIILFGDCAIESTEDYNFRTLKKKTLIRKNEKTVKNKKILSISGCPPNLDQTFNALYEYFGKKNMPNLQYYFKVIKKSSFKDSKENLKKWEGVE
ncbi:MAG: hypothetical protein BAJALOKI3v1_210004 [Promethearchaeota archaeon]|nr:MAG: hypothetical protein BAJALOKI3v1_210004 [Candidatus Lokiarchaeota archaeon]